MNSRPRSRYSSFLALVLCLILVAVLILLPTVTRADADPLAEALARAEAAGTYRFAATLRGEMLPKPLPANVGQSGAAYGLTVAGEVRTGEEPASRMLLAPPTDGSLPSLTRGPVEVVSIGQAVYARAINQPWQRVDRNPAGVPGASADYLALVHAASNVVAEGVEMVEGVPAVRYRFDMDGADYAAYLSAELARHQASGDLQVSVPRAYRTMSGSGYLWVSEVDGVPLRERLALHFPDADEQFELKVELEVAFTDHGQALAEPIVAPALGTDAPSTTDWQNPPPLQSPVSSLQSPASDLLSSAGHWPLLVLLGAAAALAWRLRRRPWAYGVVSTFVVVSMLAGPVLQAAGVARQVELRQARAAALDEILKAAPLDNVTPDWLADPHSGPPVASSEAAAAAVDSDGDGLNDELEALLGTADDEEDSDHDGLSDKTEVDGFAYNSKTWYLNPLYPDTNRDGLPDNVEMTYPDKDSPELDVDGDLIPNAWDDDNDDDGVPDSIDASPFSKTGTHSRANPFSFQVERYDTDLAEPLYLTVHLRTTNADHMRYVQAAFDWPNDVSGNITDKDGSFPRDERDLMLAPMLELTMANADHLPPQGDPELGHYAMSVISSTNKLLVPLQQMTDGGAVVGLSAKLFFPATTPAWQTADTNGRRAIQGDARVVWVLTAEDDDSGDRSVAAQYYDDFVVTGVVVDEQHGFDIALVYDNATWNGDALNPYQDPTGVLKALFDLQAGFLWGEAPTVAQLQATLNTTWNISPTLSVNRQSFEHVDAGLATTAMTTTRQILDSYPLTADPGIDVGILYAFEQSVASYNLDHITDGGLTFSSGRLTLNLSQSKGAITERGLKLDWFNTYTQQPISGERLAAVVDGYAAEWQTGEDQQAQIDLKVLLAGWRTGQTIPIKLDETPIRYSYALAPAEVPGVLETIDAGWNGIKSFLKQFKREDGELKYSKTKLVVGISFAILKMAAKVTGYDEQEVAGGGCIGSMCWESITVGSVLDFIQKGYEAYEKVHKIWKLSAYKNLFGPVDLKTKAKVLGVISLVVELTVIWTTFFIATADMDSNSPEYAFMLAYAIAQTVLAILFFVLMFTGIGTILIAIFAILDAILSLFGVDLEHEIAMWVAGLLVHIDQLTEIPEDGVTFGSVDMEMSDSGAGIIVGNEFQYTIPVTSVIQNTEEGDKGDVGDSYYEVGLVDASGVIAGFGSAWSTSPDPDCDWDSEWIYEIELDAGWRQYRKTCVQRPELHINFEHPLPDAPIDLAYESRTQLFYQICEFGSCERKTLSSTGGNVLDTVWYDVLPGRLGDPDDAWSDFDANTQGLLNWHKSGVWGGSHKLSHDPDGDGLADESWTSASNWDSDADALSDLYEREARARTSFAFNPLDDDTDDDGLNDRQEKFYGTDPARADSDGDGLGDAQEVVRATAGGLAGGWQMTLTGGGQAVTTWAFPNPIQADADNDGLTDLDEYEMRSNPNGFTVSIVIDKWAAPILRSDWPPVVRAGQRVSYTLEYFYDDAPLPTTNLVFTDDIPAPLNLVQFDEHPSGLTLSNLSATDPLVWSSSDVMGTNGFTISIVAQVPGGYASSHSISNTVRSRAVYASEPISGVSTAPTVIDNDDPGSQVRVPASGVFINGSSYVFGGEASDPTSWVAQVEARVSRTSPFYDSNWQVVTGTAAWAYTWDIPEALPGDDGTYTVQSRATDPVDHVETPGAGITVTVDNHAPQSAITSLSDGDAISMTIFYRSYVPVGTSIVVTDPYAAVYTVTGTSDDTWTMAYGVDRVSGVDRSAFSYDGGGWFAPVTTSTTGLSTTWSHEWHLPFANFEGVYWLRTRATDQIGNVETPGDGITVTVDNTPPAAGLFDPLFDLASPRFIISGTAVVTGTAVDPDYMMHEGWAPDSNPYRVQIGVGGVERVQIRASRWVTSAPIVVQDWSDAVVTPTVSDAMTATYGTTWTPTADGVHLIEARAIDHAGNTGNLTTTHEYYLYGHADALGLDTALYLADVTSPTTAITSPASGSYANDAVLLVEGTVDDGPCGLGLGHVQVSTDTGQTWTTLPNELVRQTESSTYTWQYTWDTPVVSGVYTISARAVDEAGWVGAADGITVSVDTTAPVAEISDPLHGAMISGTISGTQRIYLIQGAAKCAVGNVVSQVQVYEDTIYDGDATLLGGSANPVSWVYTWTLPTDGEHQLYAIAMDDGMDVQTETLAITVTVDTNAPINVLDYPFGWNGIITSTSTHVISGTVSDDIPTTGSGIAAVRVQTDTGQTWQGATVVSDALAISWQYTMTLEREDWVSHTVTVRTLDNAGNYSDTLFAPSPTITPYLIVDNIAPRNPMTIVETTGLTPTYWYTNTASPPHPNVTWTVGLDGGGICGYDVRWYDWEPWERKDGATQQATPPAGVYENSEMYFSLRTVDNAGNVAPVTFLGPYRLDSEKTSSLAIVDGAVETGINEWVPGELMGLDSRPSFGDVAHYATWGETYNYAPLNGEFIFLAFDGGRWNGDGDLFVYFDTDPGVSSAGVTTTWDYEGYGTHELPPFDLMTLQEAFKADYVYYIEDANTGGLMVYSNTHWITATTVATTTFAHYGDQTEIQIEWDDLGLELNDDFEMLAIVQDEITTTLVAAFPTTNDLSGSLSARYDLTLSDNLTPNANQPQAYSLALEGASWPEGAGGPGVPATYTLEYRNGGSTDIQDVVRISVTIPSNLNATCGDISGDYALSLGIVDHGGGVCVVPVSQEGGYMFPYYLPAGAGGTITLTGMITDVAPTAPITVSGYIFGDMQPDIDESDNWAYPAVLVDGTAPAPEFNEDVFAPAPPPTLPWPGSPLQTTYVAPTSTLLGLAPDNRSGAARVEVDLDDGLGWRDASGTTVWSSVLSGLSDGDTRTIRLRATDAAGNVSGAETLEVTADGLPPQSTISTPANGETFAPGETVVISGTATDGRSGVSKVELSTDGGETWSLAAYSGGVWTRNWEPREGVYTLTVRATDAVGNRETPSQQVIVTISAGGDTVGPQIGVPSYASTVTSTESLTVTVGINDASTGGHGVSAATLYYGYATPYDASQVAGTGPGGNGDGTWRFVVPPQGESHEGEMFRFSITAWDGGSVSTTDDDGGAYYGVQVTDDDARGPQIGVPSYDSIITTTESLTVTVGINDASTGGHGVSAATLYYGYAAPYDASQVAGTGPGGNGDGLWQFVVPPQGEAHVDETLRFYVTAQDGDATPATTTDDNGGSYYPVRIVAAERKVYLPLVMRSAQ